MRNSELHDTYDYLCRVDEPSYEEIQELKKKHILTDINQTENFETLDMEDFYESFIDIGELSSCLLDFSRTERGYRRKAKAMGDDKNILLDELHLTKRVQSLLEKINVCSISDLLSKTREDLHSSKLIGAKGIDEISQGLMEYNLHLKNDEIYTCTQCSRKYADVKQDGEKHYCRICQAKNERIGQISDLLLSLSDPEYASYSNLGVGFTIYANITNNTAEVQKIKLLEFYIVSEGQQRSPDSFLTGYVFNEETILPMTSRSCGKIWSRAVMKKDKLTSGDYAVITLLIANKRYMFKFVFCEAGWQLDDYFEEKL